MLSYARLRLLGGVQGARKSGSWRQLRCSLLLFLVLTSCRGEATVQDQSSIQPDCMLNWLLSLNISRSHANTYYTRFSAEFLDQRNLRLLSDSNLRELGVQAMGHRVLMLDSAASGMGEMCRNGGSCNNDTTTRLYSCSCENGFQGNNCEIAISGCQDNPCKNGGTCSEGPGSSISCFCPPCYHGDLCQYCTSQCSSLKNELETLRESSQATNLQIYDTIRRSTGLRFFKPWIEIDHYRAIYIRHFTIRSRHFIGMVIENAHHINGGLVIYEIFDSERLSHLQTLGNSSTSSFKVFENVGKFHILIGNYYEPGRIRPPDVSSKLYTWNENTSRFYMSDEIPVYGVRDVDHIKLPNNDTFLALAVHDNTRTYNLPTFIYRYFSSEGRFYFYKQFRTTAARRVNFFTFNSTLYLFVAERVNLDNSHHTNSSVYYWNLTDIVLLQEIETIGAFDLLPFSIGDCFFVVAVNNRHNYSYNVQSKVYLMIDGIFKFFTSLDTRGATKADFFQIGLDSFLVFSNSNDDVNGSVITHSVVYRMEGGKFVTFQEILTQNAMYVHFFTLQNGNPALAFANKAGKPALYKWKSLSYICPEGNCQ